MILKQDIGQDKNNALPLYNNYQYFYRAVKSHNSFIHIHSFNICLFIKSHWHTTGVNQEYND
jgi:hypothetical protein